jgi:hypothetical protein
MKKFCLGSSETAAILKIVGADRTSFNVCFRGNSGHSGMSALPAKADIKTQPRDVRFVPKADIGTQPPNIRLI